jgi:argininosuccinate lyase
MVLWENLSVYSLDVGKTLQEVSLEEYQRISESFDADVLGVVTPQQAVNSKISVGGTATPNVLLAIQDAKEELGIDK